MLLTELVQTSRRLAETRGRLAKIELVAALLKHTGPEEIEIAIAFLSGSLRQGRIGIGYATLQAAKREHAADAPTLDLGRQSRGRRGSRPRPSAGRRCSRPTWVASRAPR